MILAPLLLSTLLPIWTVWYIGPWEATGERGTLWSAMRLLPDNVRAAGQSYVWMLWAGNLKTAGLILLLGLGMERFFVLRGRRYSRRAP
jgi:hypothetical protein